MIFTAKKIMSFKAYKNINEQLEKGDIKLIEWRVFPHEATTNRIEIRLKIEVDD